MNERLPPRPAQVDRPAPGLRRVLAPNPSPMTHWGTNTYLVGTGDVAVIDPGPDDPTHIDALLAALDRGERISHIFVTHAHLDHSPGARILSAHTGAPVLAFGTATAGRSARMETLAAAGGIAGGEGVDGGFAPDILLCDQEEIAHGDWALRALWTPGHFGNHLCFAQEAEGRLFSGDLVMGWASSLVSPPDGDLGAFMRSLATLQARTSDQVYFPGHGEQIEHPAGRLADLAAHRRMRHRQVLSALAERPGTAAELAARIYTDTPAPLLGAAARNVLAHLIEMDGNSEARAIGPLRVDAVFECI